MTRTQTTTAKPHPAPSRVKRWFGAVAPLRQPEDFKEVREEFERAVAAEVAGEGEEGCMSAGLPVQREHFE